MYMHFPKRPAHYIHFNSQYSNAETKFVVILKEIKDREFIFPVECISF